MDTLTLSLFNNDVEIHYEVFNIRDRLDHGEICVDDFDIDLHTINGMPESYFSAAGKQALENAMEERVREGLIEQCAVRRMGAAIDQGYERRRDI